MVVLNLLGPLEVEVPGMTPNPLSHREGAVLAVLAHADGAYVDRDVIVKEVWGELGGTGEALHALVSRIKKKASVIDGRRDPSSYRLIVPTDYRRALNALNEGRRLLGAEEAVQALELAVGALGLWRGDPLGGIEPATAGNRVAQLSESINRLQEELRSLRIQALWELQRWPELLSGVEDYLAFYPLREDLHRYRFLATHACFGHTAAYEVFRKTKRAYLEESELVPETIRDLPNTVREAQADLQTAKLRADHKSETAVESVGCLHNLPGATYSEFIPMNELVRLYEGVSQNLPVVAVTAIGGRGKRTLVHHFCSSLVQNRDLFDAVVWVSGKQPGSATLSTVLDQLAITTRHSKLGATSDKEHEVRKLLHSQRILIVIEAYENTRDPDLDRWLTELPAPSKALLTTIEYPATLGQYCYQVELAPPSEEMMLPFYTQLLKRTPIPGLDPTHPALEQIWIEWSGNYKLLEWMIGQIPDRGLAEVRQSVSGMSDVDVVLKTILRGSWAALTDAGKSILLALACYPHGVTRTELIRVAGSPNNASALIKDLQSKFFVKNVGIDRPTFVIDPLVGRKIREPEGWIGGQDSAVYKRWLQESISRASEAGFCPEDVGRLDAFDVPGVRENLEYAITWAFDHAEWQSVIELGREMRYYYYVRGLWSPETDVHLLRAEAAQQIGDFQEEFDALVYKMNILAKQGNTEQGNLLLHKVEIALEMHRKVLSDKGLAAYRHAKALHLVNTNNLAEAQALWSINIKTPSVLGEADYSANLRWYGACLIRMGGDNYADGRAVLLQASKHAKENHFERAQMLIDLWLAKLDLESSPDRPLVEQTLENLNQLQEGLSKINDLRYTADHHYLLAHCYAVLGSDLAAHHQQLASEIDTRLGITRLVSTTPLET